MKKIFESTPILKKQFLSPEATQWINKIQETVFLSGTVGYLKGGVLRDYISNVYNGTNLDPKDLDIMLLGRINLVIDKLVKCGAKIKLQRNRKNTPVFELDLPTKFGLIKADIGIILGRPSSYKKDQLIETLIKDDMNLSDFTVNTFFLPLYKPLRTLNIIDYLKGIEDIRNRKVRMVTPDTFFRNPECMLRAVKVADRLSSVIEPVTFKTIKKYSYLIEGAPEPVINQILCAILQSPNKRKNIELLKELGLLKYLKIKY